MFFNVNCRRFGEKRCARCQASIAPNELVMRARHFIFHLNCFTCVTCQKLLTTGEQYGMKDSLIFCRTHYEHALVAADVDHRLDISSVVDIKPLVPPPPPLILPPSSNAPTMFQIHESHLNGSCQTADLLPFYNGTGTTTKGRPRKRKGPLVDNESYLQSVGQYIGSHIIRMYYIIISYFLCVRV